MKETQTFVANIYLGLKEGYDGKTKSIEEVYAVYQKYCNEIGLCVTVLPTKFIYKDSSEDGCVIGLINYPRFPSTPNILTVLACDLARLLKEVFGQIRVSVVTSDKTYMLE